MPARRMITVGAKVPVSMIAKLDLLAGKLGCTRGEFVRYLIDSAVSKPGLTDELLKLEEEKKRRLIRYIM